LGFTRVSTRIGCPWCLTPATERQITLMKDFGATALQRQPPTLTIAERAAEMKIDIPRCCGSGIRGGA
jgi:phenylacetate-coenzyme A ligase PaaK-like adenylate-forming protein